MKKLFMIKNMLIDIVYFFDIKILILTILKVFKNEGAYDAREDKANEE